MSISSCLSTYTGGFCTNSKNHFARAVRSSAFLDKLLKCTDPMLDAASVIAKAQGASDSTLTSLGKTRTFVKNARDVTAFFNIFNGIIPSLVASMRNVWNLTTSQPEVILRKGDDRDEDLYDPDRKIFTYENKAVGSTEKGLAWIANGATGIKNAAYIAGFGVCKPLATINKHISPLSETAQKIGKSFSIAMIIVHLGGIIGGVCNIIYQAVARKHIQSNKDGREVHEGKYISETVTNAIGLATDSLEFSQDMINLIGKVLTPAARLAITLPTGFFGVWKEWRKS